MSESILIIIIVIIISLGVFGFIKLVCKPIKTVTAILLVVPTVATCGIALLVYKFFRNTFEVSSYSVKSSSSSPSSTTFYDEPDHAETKKTKAKKPTSSFTDVSGKTAYYDEKGDFMGTSISNEFGQTTFYDETGNFAGKGQEDGTGRTTYTDKDGNITYSNTNYLGEENFSDGTTTKTDSSGNKYYS